MHLAAVTFPSHPVHLFSSFTVSVSVKKRHAAFVGMDPRTQLQMLFLTPLDPPNSGVRSSSVSTAANRHPLSAYALATSTWATTPASTLNGRIPWKRALGPWTGGFFFFMSFSNRSRTQWIRDHSKQCLSTNGNDGTTLQKTKIFFGSNVLSTRCRSILRCTFTYFVSLFSCRLSCNALSCLADSMHCPGINKQFCL